MTTGPEHYREAERLLAESRTVLRPNEEGHCEADRTIAEAQVHATLALAAATALVDETPRSDSFDAYCAWQNVAGAAAVPAAAPDFFQPSRTYTDAEFAWKFRVDSVTTHPEDGERTALGWRFFNGQWEPYAYGADDWEIHQAVGHTDSTEGGDAG